LPREHDVVEEDDFGERVIVCETHAVVGRLEGLQGLVAGRGQELDALGRGAVWPPALRLVREDTVGDAEVRQVVGKLGEQVGRRVVRVGLVD
jgi:hypothetical protein